MSKTMITLDDVISTLESTFSDLKKTLDKKGRDYSGEEDVFKNFKISSYVLTMPVEKVIVSRMLDKISRITNLLDNQAHVDDETIIDTIDDLIGYAVLLKTSFVKETNDKGDDGQDNFDFLLKLADKYRHGYKNISDNSDNESSIDHLLNKCVSDKYFQIVGKVVGRSYNEDYPLFVKICCRKAPYEDKYVIIQGFVLECDTDGKVNPMNGYFSSIDRLLFHDVDDDCVKIVMEKLNGKE